jgi:plastocyanin
MRDACVCFMAVCLMLTACGSDGGGPPTGNATGTITGRVVDADSGDAGVPGVTVQLAGPSGTQTVTTVATGSFSLANAATGGWQATLQLPSSHRLAASETGTRTATVSAGQTATLTQFRMARPHGSVEGSAREGTTTIAGGSVVAARGGFTSRTATPTASGYTIGDRPVGTWSQTNTPPASHELATGENGTRTVSIAENVAASASPFQLTPVSSPQLVVITLSGTTFVGGTVTIAPGTTVRWVNDSNTLHTITPENGSQAGVWQRRETSTTGTVFEHTFTEPNQVYRYRCEPHSSDFQNGMVGQITVTG